MKVRDQPLWAQQCAELAADQTAQDFLDFIVTWVEKAEQLLDEEIGSSATALRHALQHADEVHGRVSVHFLGQMLVVIATHWEYGQEMVEQLNPIELRLVQDMLALKCAELQRNAEDPVFDE